MFAYCNNNPANALDVGGYVPQGLANPNAMLHDDVFVYYGIPDYVREAEAEAQRMRRGRSLFNTDEQAVIDAKGYAFYKGQLVIKQNWAITDGCSFSFFIMFLHEKETDSSTVKHEYGHFLQLKKYGLLKYTTSIAVPSLIFNRIDSAGLLPWNYYNSPWEYEADQFGRVTRKEHTKLAKILSFIYSMQISGVRSGIYQW